MPPESSKRTTFDWITLLVALVGALAWLPILCDYYREPKLYGRVVGRTRGGSVALGLPSQTGRTETLSGPSYLLTLSLLSLKKDFAVRTCSVFVRYSGDSNEHAGRLYYFPSQTWRFGDPIGPKKLSVRLDQHLASLTVLGEGKVTVRYATFVVPYAPSDTAALDRIELRFRSFEGNVQSLQFAERDVDWAALAFDPAIWIDTGSVRGAVFREP